MANDTGVDDFDDSKPLIISAVIVANMIANSIMVAVIAKYPQLREDRLTLFVFSLALSDLGNGCTAFPISAALCSRATPNVRNMVAFLPKIHATLSVWFTTCSTHSMCLMTVCKLIAITKPLRYEQILTRNRCYFIICCIWIADLLLALTVTPFVATWNLDTCTYHRTATPNNIYVLIANVILGVVLPVCVIIYCSTRIFLVILRTHRQIAAQVNSIGGEPGGVTDVTLKSIRSARNVLVVCLAFVLLTTPYVIYMIMVASKLEVNMPSSSKFIAAWILLSNSSVNSMIYIFLFRGVRQKMAQMLRGVCN